jgi:glycosyltransferase involved in cell wall biosynthesis
MTSLVSVVIPTHDRPDLLERAILSALAQTHRELECIVIDDASSPPTGRLLERLARADKRMRCFRHDWPRGASAARNTGLAASRGRYVAFLDDDDYWLPGKLERQLTLLDDSPPSVGLVYCWFDYRIGDKIVPGRSPRLEGRIFGQLLEHQPLGNSSTLLLPRAVCEEIGGFDVDLGRGDDGDFIRRVGLHYEIRYVPEVLVHVDVGHGLPRLTAFDRKGASEALAADHAKLRKFVRELEQYPRQRAAIYGAIGFHHSLLGDWPEARRWFWRAVSSQPFYYGAYRPMLRAGKVLTLRGLHRRRRAAPA